MLVELCSRSKDVVASRPRAWVRRGLGLARHLGSMAGKIGGREGDDVVACHDCVVDRREMEVW